MRFFALNWALGGDSLVFSLQFVVVVTRATVFPSTLCASFHFALFELYPPPIGDQEGLHFGGSMSFNAGPAGRNDYV